MSDYKELVEKANSAVQGVKDPELRRVAFEKILEDLLKGGIPSGNPKRPVKAIHNKVTGTRASVGPKTYIEEMVDEGFFKKPKTMAEVKVELENRGHHIPFTSLSSPLQKLCQAKILRRQKITKGKKNTFSYSNY